MRKSQIFTLVLEAVSRETEIPSELILSSCKQTEVVDARSLLVHFLSLQGLYPSQIALLIGKTPASVRYLMSHFSARKTTCKMLEIQTENVHKSIENN